MKYCSQCGNPMDDDMLFCQQCGTRYVNVKADKEIEEEEIVSVDEDRNDNITIKEDSQKKAGPSFDPTSIWKSIEEKNAPIFEGTKEKLVSTLHGFSQNAKLAICVVSLLIVLLIIILPFSLLAGIANNASPNNNETDGSTIETEYTNILEWPTHVYASMVPNPQATYGSVELANDNELRIYVARVEESSFSSYVDLCISAGFSEKPNRTETAYSAVNAEGYRLNMSYDTVSKAWTMSIREPAYAIDIKLECETNWFFAKYKIEIYMDDNKIGTLDHGADETYHLELAAGEHALKITKEGTPSISGSVTINIKENANIIYNVVSHDDRVAITEKKYESLRPLTENEIKMPVNASEYKEKNYNDVILELKGLGFTNVIGQPLYELSSDWFRGEVTSVSIGGKSDFKKNDILNKDSPVVVVYRMRKDEAPPPETKENEALIPKDFSEYNNHIFTSFNYDLVVDELKKAGFTNFEITAVYDIDFGIFGSSPLADVGDFYDVSINGNKNCKKWEVYPKNTLITVRYRDWIYNEPGFVFTSYTAKKMLDDMENNAANAKSKYDGAFVEVTGRVDFIASDGDSFMLFPSDSKYGVIGIECCIMNVDEQKSFLRNLSKNDIVTIKGKITTANEFGYTLDIYLVS